MTDHAISRLIAKRAELARLAAELEQELDQCRVDLVHIDGALRILRADLDPESVPPRRRYERTRYFGRNELSRLYMDTLRQAASEPLTAEEITFASWPPKGLIRETHDSGRRSVFRLVQS